MTVSKTGLFLSTLFYTLVPIHHSYAANQIATTGIEAESYDTAQGVAREGTNAVGSLDNGDFLQYQKVNFGNGVSTFEALVAVDPAYAGQKIEIRLDSATGPKVGELTVKSTGGWTKYEKQSTPIQTISGIRDLYLVARGTYGVANIDKFKFIAQTRNAFADIEAEIFDAAQGVQSSGGVVGYMDNGDYLQYRNVDFGSGATSFSALIAVDPGYAGQKIELRLNGAGGTKVGELTLASTGGWGTSRWQTATFPAISGVQDLFLVVKGTYGAGNLDKFRFGTDAVVPPAPPPSRTPSGPIAKNNEAVVEIKNVRISGSPGNCITVTGAQTSVLIDNVELSGCGEHGIRIANSANVTIKNSYFHDLSHDKFKNADGIFIDNVTGISIDGNKFANIYTTDSGNTDGQDNFAVGVRAIASTNVSVQHNNFENVGTGLYAIEYSNHVNFSYNTGLNMQGPFPRGQLVQFASVRGGGNRVTCNKVDNTGVNHTEDNINLFDTQGLPDDPVLVAYNRIKGGSSKSGSGIMVGDGSGKSIRVIKNHIINPWNVGIGVAGGEDIVVDGNKIYKNFPGNSGEGLKVANFSPAIACKNITLTNNDIRWNEAGQQAGNEYACIGTNCETYWSMAMNISSSGQYACSVNGGLSNDVPGSNNVDATNISETDAVNLFNNPLPECN